MRWYNKMLYALAHSIPGRTFWEKAFLGRVVMACAGLTLVGELMVVGARLTEFYFVFTRSEPTLWMLIAVAFLITHYFTIGSEELEHLEVPYRERRAWTRWSWSVVIVIQVVIPFILVA